ncbi:MAG: ACT domain-containing protein [Pseudomonadota bacterium]
MSSGGEGEQNLASLLQALDPVLEPQYYVFCSVPELAAGDWQRLAPVAACREEEGVTLVVLREVADTEGMAYSGVCHRITLRVHSSLEAVGLTAAVAGALAAGDISANVVAGRFHDHVFVPADRAEEAFTRLRQLSD